MFVMGAFLFGSFVIMAQQLEFTLSKGLTVGCSGANPLTDMTKKMNVSIDGDKGVLTYASINCKRTIEGTSLGVINEGTKGTLYFNERDSKGFIVEGTEKILLINKQDGAYKVLVVGHADKKLAKNFSAEVEQENYNAVLSKLDSVIEEAKKKKAADAIVANTLPVPTGSFTDKYEISGTYYLSELQKITNKQEYVQAVNLEFKTDIPRLHIHFKDGGEIKAFFHEMVLDGFRDGIVDPMNTYFECEFYYDLETFSRTRLYPIEKGLYLITLSGYSSFGSRLDCSEPYINEKKDAEGNLKFMLLGKDKERIAYLLSHPEELVELGKEAYVKVCEQFNAIKAADQPMPAPGMNDTKLNAEITQVVKAHAATAKWPQTVVYAYAKNKEWDIIRNKNTGIIVGRSLRAIVVLKTSSGKCQWEEILIKQAYDGANYGSSYWGGNTAIIVPVDCTEAMKYKK